MLTFQFLSDKIIKKSHFTTWQFGKIGVLVNFITQKLKSKHLAISVFSGQRFFWENERKYFPHISGLTNNKLLKQIARTIGQQQNATKNVMQKNVWSPNYVRRTARIPVIYVKLKKLARIKKVPNIVTSNWKRGNVANQRFGRNVRRLVTNANWYFCIAW